MFEVYITKSGKYLPNEPVSNDEMETYLGLINETASKARVHAKRADKVRNFKSIANVAADPRF